MIGGDYPAAMTRARSAVASAEKAGSVGLPTIMMMQAHIDAASGVPNVMALVDRAVALAESTRRSGPNHTDGFTDYEFHVFRDARALRACFLWRFADRADEARTELRWFYEQAVERGDESSIPMLLLNLSGAEAVLGNWTEARGLVEDAHEGSLEMGRQPFVESWCFTQRAFLDAVLGRVTASREAAERALTLADEAGANDPRVFTLQTLGLL